jgi:hypothetical protein
MGATVGLGVGSNNKIGLELNGKLFTDGRKFAKAARYLQIQEALSLLLSPSKRPLKFRDGFEKYWTHGQEPIQSLAIIGQKELLGS